MSLTVVAVRRSEPSDLSQFGITVKQRNESPTYTAEDGVVWKSACLIYVWDDGRMTVVVLTALTERELGVVYGLAEDVFSAGVAKCKYEKWTRLRKTNRRRIGGYRVHYYVRADDADPHKKWMSAAMGDEPEKLLSTLKESVDTEVSEQDRGTMQQH